MNPTLYEVCSVCSEERVRAVSTVNGDASLLPTVKEKPLLPQVGVVLAQEVNVSSGGAGECNNSHTPQSHDGHGRRLRSASK